MSGVAPLRIVPWHRPMTGRDPDEPHRATTPLELLFDLSFVVAVAAAAAALHHELAYGHFDGLVPFAMMFFGIWWAWLNYSWFASAYDTGDVVFRLLTLLVMAGVLVLASGVPTAAGASHDTTVIVVGYVMMRLALVPLWLRVAREHPACRGTALKYAGGIALVQVLWVLRAVFAQSGTLGYVTFAVLVAAELTIPWVAEHPVGTPWHRGHVAERFSLFTIIVLGEVILSTTSAISAVVEAGHVTAELLSLVVGALVLVFGMWWLYFKREPSEVLEGVRWEDAPFFFGYLHFLVLSSAAAVGAALAVGVDALGHEAHASPGAATVSLGASTATYLLALGAVHALTGSSPGGLLSPALAAAVVLVVGLLGLPVGVTVLLLATVVVVAVVHDQRQAYAAARDRGEADLSA